MSTHQRFTRETRIRFADVDYARILYFPRQIHYLLVVLEDFLDEGLGMPVRQLFERHNLGLPTVNVQVDFMKSLRFGDVADVSMWVERLGTTSMTLGYEVVDRATGETTCKCRHTVVFTDQTTLESVPIPDAMRAALAPFVAQQDDRSAQPA